jgi:hypothetical protein
MKIRTHLFLFLIACCGSCTTILFVSFDLFNTSPPLPPPPPLLLPPPPSPPRPPPCILIKTVPGFRLCTLDPDIDEWSRLAHTTRPSLLSHWPLIKLLKNINNDNLLANDYHPAYIIDTIPKLGYFSFEAAFLGASVVAVESDTSLVSLMTTSLALNHNMTVRILHGSGCPSVHSALRTRKIDILRIDGKDIQSCEHELARGVRYMFLEFTPSKLKNPERLLVQLVSKYHMNIFEDKDGENGALETSDFQYLIKGIGLESRTLFLAHNSFS